MLIRASQKVSKLRVEIATVDLQVECLCEIFKQKDEEIMALENEICILQGKLKGIQEIKALIHGELEKRIATLVELNKRKETSCGSEEPIICQ